VWTYVGVLVGGDGDELCLEERVRVNGPLGDAVAGRDLDHVDAWLIAVHRVKNYLSTNSTSSESVSASKQSTGWVKKVGCCTVIGISKARQ